MGRLHLEDVLWTYGSFLILAAVYMTRKLLVAEMLKSLGVTRGFRGYIFLLMRILLFVLGTLVVYEAYLMTRLYLMSVDVISQKIPLLPKSLGTGQGILFPAGGPEYLALTYANIKIMRKYANVKLPVEIVYLGKEEMPSKCHDFFLNQLGGEIYFKDASLFPNPLVEKVPERDGNVKNVEKGGNYQIKPYSLAVSRFLDTLLLDPDSFLIGDPKKVFESENYKRSGNCFWPDVHKERSISYLFSPITGMERDVYEETESGQIAINKEKSWGGIFYSWYMNSHSSILYWFLHGDKDSYGFGFKIAGEYVNQNVIEPHFLGVIDSKTRRFIRTAFIHFQPPPPSHSTATQSRNLKALLEPFTIHVVGSKMKSRMYNLDKNVKGDSEVLWTHEMRWEMDAVSPSAVRDYLDKGYVLGTDPKVVVRRLPETFQRITTLMAEGISEFKGSKCFQ
eukprot:Nk52_evm93s207 gene=Nk52_evmTU93s207